MKLLKIHISSFGRFKDYTYSFDKNITSINQPNGFGKTTLSMFISAMLYGLNDLTIRKKYMPWDNPKTFGGSMDIEVSGKKYIITREFNLTSELLDKCTFYDVYENKNLNVGDNIGEYLLNINEKSFERSLFIPETAIKSAYGTDLETKLQSIIGGTNDSKSYDNSKEEIEHKLVELKDGNSGLIIDLENEINDLNNEINETKEKLNEIKNIQGNIVEVKKQISNKEQEKKNLNNELLKYTKETDKRANALVASKYSEDIKNSKLELEENNKIFNNANIESINFTELTEKSKELGSIKSNLEFKKQDLSKTSKMIDFQKEKIIYKNDYLDDDILDHQKKLIDKYLNIKTILEAHEHDSKSDKPVVAILLLVFAILSGILGGVLLFLGIKDLKDTYKFIAYGLFGLLVILLVFAGFSFYKYNTKDENNAYGNIKNYDFELKQTEAELKEFFGYYHLYSKDYMSSYYSIKANIDRYYELMAKYKEIYDSINDDEDKIEIITNSLNDVFQSFNLSNDNNEDKINEILIHVRKKEELEKTIKEKEEQYNSYILEHGLKDYKKDEFNIENLNKKQNEIDNDVSNLNNSLLTFKTKVNEYDTLLDKYYNLIFERNSKIDELDICNEKYDNLTKTLDELNKAEAALLERYVKPIKDSVGKYLNMFMKISKDDYNIDATFKFRFVTKHGLKPLESYSLGNQIMVTLCMRLALIDCMYPKEKPFVILDDPFAAFDDKRMEECKELLKKVSNKYQIIYFTCQESREVH